MCEWTDTEIWLARAILNLADSASMPDSFWQTDRRVTFAREILGVGMNDRYERGHEWDNLYEED